MVPGKHTVMLVKHIAYQLPAPTKGKGKYACISSQKPLKKLSKFGLRFIKIHDIFSTFRPQSEKLSWSGLTTI